MTCGGGVAVAVAGDGRRDSGLGIDAGRFGRSGPRLEETDFSPEERELLGALAQAEREEWTLRMACAKEAGKKALGRDAAADPGPVRAIAIDAVQGTVRLGMGGAPAGNLTAWTGRHGDLVVATALSGGGP